MKLSIKVSLESLTWALFHNINIAYLWTDITMIQKNFFVILWKVLIYICIRTFDFIEPRKRVNASGIRSIFVDGDKNVM